MLSVTDIITIIICIIIAFIFFVVVILIQYWEWEDSLWVKFYYDEKSKQWKDVKVWGELPDGAIGKPPESSVEDLEEFHKWYKKNHKKIKKEILKKMSLVKKK